MKKSSWGTSYGVPVDAGRGRDELVTPPVYSSSQSGRVWARGKRGMDGLSERCRDGVVELSIYLPSSVLSSVELLFVCVFIVQLFHPLLLDRRQRLIPSTCLFLFD